MEKCLAGNEFEKKWRETEMTTAFSWLFVNQFLYFEYAIWFKLVKPIVKRLSNINNRNRLEKQR